MSIDLGDPLAALSACHRQIESQLAILAQLQAQLALGSVDDEARATAANILNTFVEVAALHHADEEVDLFPRILRAADDVSDRAHTFELISHLLAEHCEIESSWRQLRPALEALISGESAALDRPLCEQFSRQYAAHIAHEECDLSPLAARLLSKDELAALGRAMAARRGLASPTVET